MKADPAYGAKSALYGAFGYVPRSARKSGLSRKETGSTTEGANAA